MTDIFSTCTVCYFGLLQETLTTVMLSGRRKYLIEYKLEVKKPPTHTLQPTVHSSGYIMAPLSAGTGRGAVRGFGLKLQQSSSTVAWLQPKPSTSSHVHLPHLPLNTLRPPPGPFCLHCARRPRVDRMD